MDEEADYHIPAAVWSRWKPATGAREIVRALSDDERMLVAAREYELREGLRPIAGTEKDAAVGALSKMLGGFRSLKQQDEFEAAATLDGLRRVIAEFPLWAIREGCLAIQRGAAVIDGHRIDRRFPPNDGEVYGVIENLVKPYREALRRVSALLSAPVEHIQKPAKNTFTGKSEP